MPWSDWIDGPVTTVLSTLTYGRITSEAAENEGASVETPPFQTHTTRPADGPALIDAAASLATLLGDVNTAGSLPTSSGAMGVNISALKTGSSGSAEFGYTAQNFQTAVQLTQEIFDFAAATPPLDYDHAVLDALTYGVDYGPSPDGSVVTYEAVEPTFDGWNGFDLGVRVRWLAAFKQWDSSHAYIVENAVAPEFSYRAVAGHLLSGGSADWQTYGVGSEVASLSGNAPDPTQPVDASSGSARFTDTAGLDVTYDLTLDLSTVTANPATVVNQVNYQSLDEPFTDFTVVNHPGNTEVEGSTLTLSKQISLSAETAFAGSPQARYQQPRWRYWIPDGGPLRTIGDHFRSVGGADVKSLIPGVGWVKVRPGT